MYDVYVITKNGFY